MDPMTQAPLLSTITLFTEFVVTFAVVTVFRKSITTGKFPTKLAFGTLLYEIFFNISYMIFSSSKREAHEGPFTWKTGVAITHGVLSLVMFVCLIWFFVTAFRHYKKGENYFKLHKTLTLTFLFFWLVSVFSGAFLYIAEYVL